MKFWRININLLLKYGIFLKINTKFFSHNTWKSLLTFSFSNKYIIRFEYQKVHCAVKCSSDCDSIKNKQFTLSLVKTLLVTRAKVFANFALESQKSGQQNGSKEQESRLSGRLSSASLVSRLILFNLRVQLSITFVLLYRYTCSFHPQHFSNF